MFDYDRAGYRDEVYNAATEADRDKNGFCCGAIAPHEHVWAYAYTDFDESACGACNKQKAGGVEDWCGDFCFGPGMCPAVGKIDIERCELCGERREKP